MENKEHLYEEVIRKELNKQFLRGMYTGCYGLSGAVHKLILDFRGHTKHGKADLENLINKIDELCTVKLINPDDEVEK